MNQIKVKKEPIFIIIPVYNRKNITLKCIGILKENGDLDKYHVIVVDDGSTDGTSEALNSLYPDIIILRGNGNLWWTGSIRMGMEYAYKHNANFIILLNDDCYPQRNTIYKLLIKAKLNCFSIIGVQCLDPDTYKPNYGGIITKNNRIEFTNEFENLSSEIECDGLNGNLLCIPSNVIDVIGYPDSVNFPHHFGDFIYTNLAKKNNYKLILCKDISALCSYESKGIESFKRQALLIKLFQSFFHPNSQFYWKTEIKAYIQLFGLKGVYFYFYKRFILSTIKLVIYLIRLPT